jgi:hypothetical protein
MTPRDAAHLLIAANCSQDVQDSVDTVHRYGKLPHVGNAWRDFPALAALGDKHSFADALATLLNSESVRFLAEDPRTTIFVTFNHPVPEVSLEVSTHGWERIQEYKTPWPSRAKITSRVHLGDRQVRYVFTEKTIFTIGNLCGSGREHGRSIPFSDFQR